jgi:hypothetical protein
MVSAVVVIRSGMVGTVSRPADGFISYSSNANAAFLAIRPLWVAQCTCICNSGHSHEDRIFAVIPSMVLSQSMHIWHNVTAQLLARTLTTSTLPRTHEGLC